MTAHPEIEARADLYRRCYKNIDPAEAIDQLCVRLAAADLLEVRLRDLAVAEGFKRAIATFRGIHERTGSQAARWAADYLTVDPDRMALRPSVPVSDTEPRADSVTRTCGNEREPDGERCTGTLTFGRGEYQARCPVCGGWTGRDAPADVTVARTRRPDYARAVRDVFGGAEPTQKGTQP